MSWLDIDYFPDYVLFVTYGDVPDDSPLRDAVRHWDQLGGVQDGKVWGDGGMHYVQNLYGYEWVSYLQDHFKGLGKNAAYLTLARRRKMLRRLVRMSEYGFLPTDDSNVENT